MLKTRGFWDWLFSIEARNVYTRYHQPSFDDVLVDVGAHIGSFSVAWAPKVAVIHAFEPFPENYSLLIENLELNRAGNVIPYNLALSDYVGMAQMGSELAPLQGATGDLFCTKDCIDVPVTTLDSVIEGRVDFIKLDCEHSEAQVLNGSRRILAEHRPYIAAEVHDQDNLDYIVNILHEYGYDIAYSGYWAAWLLYAMPPDAR